MKQGSLQGRSILKNGVPAPTINGKLFSKTIFSSSILEVYLNTATLAHMKISDSDISDI